MTDIKWDAKYSIGHERIDHEHQVFLDLIRNASLAVENNYPKDKVLRLMNEVKKYAEFHFYSEENIMLDVEYPDYEEHCKKHRMLLSNLENQLHNYNTYNGDLSVVVEFLYNWFALHTTTIDKELAAYIQDQ